MRKYVKKKILETIRVLKEKHAEIGMAYERGNERAVQELFAGCQENAVLIGNTIEADGGSHEKVIKVLEEYCEALYEQALGQMEFSEKKLNESIAFAKNYVINHIPEKLEAVFFPYKASMWDSLESVWTAASDDPDCDAFVVPIPYFDRNPDGTVSAMHYEGDEFPEYVPVTRWEEYDVAARHPDMVYIHNPYDHANKVTTVHPDFYAKELKKHTDLLVYIPYFVCVGDAVPAHFCVLPGTMYADRVIVQSEKAREIYIREFHKFEEEYHCKGCFGSAEEKFVALGSPKYDKISATARESLDIPEEWMAKLIRPDKSRKKVLLYNTSVGQLLQGEKQVLAKLRSVFELVRNRKDLVLLWRPHPLSETAYAAMRPELLSEYHKIVEEYKRENWGIFDDTPDLHRAIALSDAYYGDMSSLVELYRVTGKPVMIQDIYMES